MLYQEILSILLLEHFLLKVKSPIWNRSDGQEGPKSEMRSHITLQQEGSQVMRPTLGTLHYLWQGGGANRGEA